MSEFFFQNLASSKFQQHYAPHYAPPLSNFRLQFHGIKWNVKNMHTKLSNAPVPKSNIVTKIQNKIYEKCQIILTPKFPQLHLQEQPKMCEIHIAAPAHRILALGDVSNEVVN